MEYRKAHMRRKCDEGMTTPRTFFFPVLTTKEPLAQLRGRLCTMARVALKIRSLYKILAGI